MADANHKNDDRYDSLLSGPLVEPTPRWVRVKFGGDIIADSRRVLLLRQYGPGRLPTYFFPLQDVQQEALTPGSPPEPDGEVVFWSVQAGGEEAQNAAWAYRDPAGPLADLRDHISFSWRKMDAWYEEDEQVFVHARDPYKRVDVMASSRRVRIEVEGQIIAESSRPFLLFETHLPTRYYLPQEDVRMDLLKPSDLVTRCPYKGSAVYWNLKLGDRAWPNIVWSYPEPIPENPKIRKLMCFFNEQIDLYVDGELQERPLTPWS